MPDVDELPQDREKRRRERDAAIRNMLAGSYAPEAPAPDTRPEWLQAYSESQIAPVEAEQAAERERAQRGIDTARRARVRRDDAYERGLGDGIDHDVAENADDLIASLSGAREGLTLGLDDEIASMLQWDPNGSRSSPPSARGLNGVAEEPSSPPRAEVPYHQAREQYGADRRREQMETPRSWVTAEERLEGPQRSGYATAGELIGGLPWAALTPAGAASRVPGAIGVAERALQAGRAAAPIATVSGFGRSESSLVPTGPDQTIADYLRGAGDVALDTVREGAQGFVLGAGGQLVGEAAGALGQGVASELRPGSAGPQRRLVSDVREDDVIRERINLASEEAAARRLREASGGRALLTNLRAMDDVPGGVRRVASELRDAGVVAPEGTMMQSPPDAIPRARVLREEVGGRIRATDDAVESAYRVDGNADAMVDLEPLALGYARVAERMTEAGDAAGAERMMRIAEQTADRGSVSMREAREVLANIDAAIHGRHGAIPAPQVSRLDDEFSAGLRRALRSEMDGAIERVNPTRGAPLPQGAQGPAEALPSHLADRQRFQALNAFGEATGDIPLRDAGRRVVSPSDNVAALAGSMTGGPITGAAMWIANRVLRANEHGVAAMLAEREVAALERELAQRLTAPVATRVLERLRPAIARGRHMTALALMQLMRDEPELERALESAPPSEDAADDERANELLGDPASESGDINEDEDEARARDLL